MFFPGSRYERTGTYSVTKPNGVVVSVAKLPLPRTVAAVGFHRRLEGQRLDLIASAYLRDATAFWQLCDASDAVIPDALAARDLVGIPPRGR
jgi:hypothetical protein